MKRSTILALIRNAGYHNDSKELVRLYIENRVSYKVAQDEFRKGIRAKENGVPCTCSMCKK